MRFSVLIDYSQISVCNSEAITFSQWNDEHVAQGFVWRENHISFGIPDHDGLCLVETQLVTEFPAIKSDVLRAIEVPFSAPNGVTIATIMEDFPINDLPHGDYGLQFRLLKAQSTEKESESSEDYAYFLQFFFLFGKSNNFEILRKSGEMTAEKILTKKAILD